MRSVPKAAAECEDGRIIPGSRSFSMRVSLMTMLAVLFFWLIVLKLALLARRKRRSSASANRRSLRWASA